MKSKKERIECLCQGDYYFDKNNLSFLSNNQLIEVQKLIIEVMHYGLKQKIGTLECEKE